jgi:hypothetical protein
MKKNLTLFSSVVDLDPPVSETFCQLCFCDRIPNSVSDPIRIRCEEFWPESLTGKYVIKSRVATALNGQVTGTALKISS